VKAYAGKPLDDKDLEEARTWGERLQVPEYERLLDLLRHAPFSKEQKAELQRWSSLYAVRLEESAGLDVVYDGEQQRTEMYDWAVSHANGFERRGSVRAFDNKYYSKAAVVGPISLGSPFHNAEFSYLTSVAEAELKIPVTGAYTIADWSFDERNRTPENLLQPAAERSRERKAARRDFVLEVARNLIRPNLEALITLGARWIQVDEPGRQPRRTSSISSSTASTPASRASTRCSRPTCASLITTCSFRRSSAWSTASSSRSASPITTAASWEHPTRRVRATR